MAEYENLSLMKQAGCVSVGMGVESRNPQILKASGKGITIEEAKKVVRIAKEIGLNIRCFFIFGDPFETLKTAMDTIKVAATLNPTAVSFGIMVPYPKTKIAEMAKKGEGNYRIISKDWNSYDKYLGNALELKNLRKRKLYLLQGLSYIYFYLYNFRFMSLSRFIFINRTAVLNQIKIILRSLTFKRR